MNPAIPVIEIDRSSGFCSGVNRAIKIAEDKLLQEGPIYCLGNLVHNEEELERLNRLGMRFIRHDEINGEMKTVFIRAHGEPPETYSILGNNNASVVDATCPVVLRLQHKVRESSRQFRENGSGLVIIYGKPGHPEITGLLGQTEGNAILISKLEETGSIDYNQPLHLYAQTTAGEEQYVAICRRISENSLQQTGRNDLVTVHNTICRQMSHRAPRLREFAQKHDVIIFVTGSESSNGRYLSGVAREVNPETHVVGSPSDVDNWFAGARSIGITGATSTPLWLMEEVAGRIKAIVENNL